MEAAGPTLRIFVDADTCPVKDEVYSVAARYGLTVFVVANSPIVVPRAQEIERVVVGAGPDAADEWIAERAGARRNRRHVAHSAGESMRGIGRRRHRAERKAL